MLDKVCKWVIVAGGLICPPFLTVVFCQIASPFKVIKVDFRISVDK